AMSPMQAVPSAEMVGPAGPGTEGFSGNCRAPPARKGAFSRRGNLSPHFTKFGGSGFSPAPYPPARIMLIIVLRLPPSFLFTLPPFSPPPPPPSHNGQKPSTPAATIAPPAGRCHQRTVTSRGVPGESLRATNVSVA